MPRYAFFLVVCFLSGMLSAAQCSENFKMLFRSNGMVTLGVHLYGDPRYGDLGPGYRSDLVINTEFFGYNNLVFDLLTAASTSIARLPETPVKLDKIRYNLTPELRYSFRKSIVTASLYHLCIHTLSREEDENGSTWWNALQIGGGTKGAYSFYFIQKYNNREFSLRNSFDGTVNFGYYLHGEHPLIGHNHEYQYDASGLLRYHFGLFRNQTLYVDVNSRVWFSKNGMVTYKLSGELNYVILAYDNIATLYYSHCFVDENPYDNEFSLGAVGLKLIF